MGKGHALINTIFVFKNMEEKRKKKKGIIFLSIYFVLFGILFMTNGFYYETEKSIKKDIYRRSKSKLPDIQEVMDTTEFRRAENRMETLFMIKELKEELKKFKKKKIERISIVAVLISCVGFLAGLLFVFIGFGTLGKLVYPFHLVAPTLFLLGIFSGLYFYNTSMDIQYYDGIAVRIWEISSMFSGKYALEIHLELARSFTKYLFFRTTIFIACIMIFYLLPLVYLLNVQNKEKQKLVSF